MAGADYKEEMKMKPYASEQELDVHVTIQAAQMELPMAKAK